MLRFKSGITLMVVSVLLFYIVSITNAMDLQITNATIKYGNSGSPSSDSFKFVGKFKHTLQPVDLTSVPVTITVGSYTETIPAGSFTRNNAGDTFKYTSNLQGINKIKLSYKTKQYEFSAKNVDMSELDALVYVNMDITDDSGCIYVEMKEKKDGSLKATKKKPVNWMRQFATIPGKNNE